MIILFFSDFLYDSLFPFLFNHYQQVQQPHIQKQKLKKKEENRIIPRVATQSHFKYVSFCLFCPKTRIQVQRGRKRKSSQTGCRESTPGPPFICSRQDAHYFSSPPHPQFLQTKTHTQEALTVSISPFIFPLLHNSFPHMVVEESASPQATNNFSALPSLPSPAA